jgi:CheY-like chemotaxis protein/predicted regulator of Ras-like GTPase activity (Roadblock/LC7/MglB family)
MPKVLVIDDSVSVRKVVERALAGKQVDVVCAASGTEALDCMERDAPDVIVCDVVMPDRDGYEICEFVKKHPRLGDIPVLLMSGIVNDEVKQRAARARSEGVLAKPFAAEDLLKRLDGFLGPLPPRQAETSPAKAPAASPGAAAPLMPVSELTVPPLDAPTPAPASKPTTFISPKPAPAITPKPTPLVTPKTPPVIAPKPAPVVTPPAVEPTPVVAPPRLEPAAVVAPPPVDLAPVVAPPAVEPAAAAITPVEVIAPVVEPVAVAPAPTPRPQPEPETPARKPTPVLEPIGAEPAVAAVRPPTDAAAAILAQFTAMDGVQWAVLSDREGFVVEATTNAGIDADVAAALSACLAESSEGLGRELGRGTLHGIILEYEKGIVVVYGAGVGGLLAVGLTESAVLGKVRYFAKKALPELMRSL